MIEYLARYVLEASSESLLALTLEDIALVHAWLNAQAHDDRIMETFSGIADRIDLWLEHKCPPERVTEGARQQPILRSCIDILCDKGPQAMNRDELNFIVAVHELILRSKASGQFQRPLQCITPHLSSVERQRQITPEIFGLPNIMARVMVATEAAILEAPDRSVQVFGGIPYQFRGPMLVHHGTLKIIGDIPDGAAVIVSGGSCYVSGYILGCLHVGEHAEVQENISGLLIAQRGNVRTRGIVNHATVIAKSGRIACGSTQSPTLVYAGTQLRIRQSAFLGTYMAPQIRVEGSINGGTWHLTNSLRAEKLVHTSQRPLDIVFRKRMSHEDFGEILPADATLLLRRAVRLQARGTYLMQLKKRQDDEAEHYASTALYYLCSVGECQEELFLMDTLKRRRSFLLRLMMGLHMLTKSLMNLLKESRTARKIDPDTQQSVQLAIRQSLGEVTRELSELKLEGGYPEELDKEWGELVALHADSLGRGANDGLAKAILRFDDSRRTWRQELLQLNERIEALQLRIAGDAGRKALLEMVQSAGTSQPVLLQLARAAQQRGPKDSVARRMATPFVRRMLDLLKKRNDWSFRYGAEAAQRESDLNAVHRKLREIYGIGLGTPRRDPRIEGVFHGAVRLHLDDLITEPDSHSEKLLVVSPLDSMEPSTYTVCDESIVRLGVPHATVAGA